MNEVFLFQKLFFFVTLIIVSFVIKQMISDALCKKSGKTRHILTDHKVVTSNYLGDSSKYVLGGAHSFQFGYMTEGEFNAMRLKTAFSPGTVAELSL